MLVKSTTCSLTTSILINAICYGLVTLAVATIASAQYNYGSGDGKVMSQSELAKLMRNSAKLGRSSASNAPTTNFDDSVNANYAPISNRRSTSSRNQHQHEEFPGSSFGKSSSHNGFGPTDGLNGYSMGSSPNSRAANNDDDDDAPAGFGSSFNENDDEGSNNDNENGRPMKLNQAASGYPEQDENDNVNGFGPPSFDGSEFNGADAGGFGNGGNSGRLRQAGSFSNNARKRYSNDEDTAGIPAYNPGPNSAVNAEGEPDEDPRGAQNNGEGDDDD